MRYSPFCVRHLRSKRRHGDPLQRGISATELKPYKAKVRRLLAGHANREMLEAAVRQLAGNIAGASRAVLHDFERGVPSNRYEVKAARTILNILEEVDALSVAVTVAALALLRDKHPKTFASDRGFVFEVARQFRSLTDAAIMTHFNARTGETKRVQREFPPRAYQILGQTLIDTFGRVTAHAQRLTQKADNTTLNRAVDAAFA